MNLTYDSVHMQCVTAVEFNTCESEFKCAHKVECVTAHGPCGKMVVHPDVRDVVPPPPMLCNASGQNSGQLPQPVRTIPEFS